MSGPTTVSVKLQLEVVNVRVVTTHLMIGHFARQVLIRKIPYSSSVELRGGIDTNLVVIDSGIDMKHSRSPTTFLSTELISLPQTNLGL